jgi:hypothetical protein
MKTVFDYLARRKPLTNEFFPCPGSRKTVLVTSSAWWMEHVAYGLLKLGYNVLAAEPWSLFWTDRQRQINFDTVFNQWVQAVRKFGVQLVLGDNSTALVRHPRNRELLHRAAGVPLVNWWCDDPRALPVGMADRGHSPHDYLAALRDGRVLNALWDLDVCEELQQFLAVPNVTHVPLGVTPEFWEPANPTPLTQRPPTAFFLGDNDDDADAGWERRCDPLELRWAQDVAKLRLANPDRPAAECVLQVGGPGEVRGNTARRPYELASTVKDEFDRWGVLNRVLLRDARGTALRAAAGRLDKDLVLIGRGWERAGFSPADQQIDAAGARDTDARSRASLCAWSAGSHGGVPRRAYEIAASGGLLLSQHTRELPAMFEPGRECVAFRSTEEMIGALDRVTRSPAEFESVIDAGRRRAAAEHTWEKRLTKLLQLAKERFDLPW